jgi:hypothetical protein
VGVTESQLPEVTAAVKLKGAPVLVMVTVWLAGAAPPTEKENGTEPGFAERPTPGVILRMLSYWPGLAAINRFPEAFTATSRVMPRYALVAGPPSPKGVETFPGTPA